MFYFDLGRRSFSASWLTSKILRGFTTTLFYNFFYLFFYKNYQILAIFEVFSVMRSQIQKVETVIDKLLGLRLRSLWKTRVMRWMTFALRMIPENSNVASSKLSKIVDFSWKKTYFFFFSITYLVLHITKSYMFLFHQSHRRAYVISIFYQ